MQFHGVQLNDACCPHPVCVCECVFVCVCVCVVLWRVCLDCGGCVCVSECVHACVDYGGCVRVCECVCEL